MDISKALEFTSQYVAEYLTVAGLTLAHPGVRFAPQILPEGTGLVDGRGIAVTGSRLDPRLYTFVVISLTIGTVIANAWHGRTATVDTAEVVLLASLWWLISSSAVHVFCRMLGGKGNIGETLSVTLQINSVVFAVCAMLTLVIASAARLADGAQAPAWLGNPVLVYNWLSGILLILYIPFGLRVVHGFGRFRSFILFCAVVGAVVIGSVLSTAVYKQSEGRRFIPRALPRSR